MTERHPLGVVSPKIQTAFRNVIERMARMEESAHVCKAALWDQIYAELHLDPDQYYGYDVTTGQVYLEPKPVDLADIMKARDN